MIEIVLFVLPCLLGVGELYIWYSEILWHKSEPKPDPRNNLQR